VGAWCEKPSEEHPALIAFGLSVPMRWRGGAPPISEANRFLPLREMSRAWPGT